MQADKFSEETPELRNELQTLRSLAGLSQPLPETGAVSFALDVGGAGDLSGLFDERQIHTWDLVDVSYLERGAIVARAVGKLHARDAQGPYVGTGFLVSDRLLVTSCHNLPTAAIAADAFVEFEHELGPDALPRDPQRFVLKPDDAYWSNAELDVCVVAVAPLSQGNTPLSRYGWLRLNPEVGKIDVGQFISIVHHPDGEWKQVALRENRLLKKDDTVLWYASDTLPGSSGAPCFSDQWQVVAVHRRGIPETKEDDVNQVALRNGEYMTRQQIQDLHILDRDIVWVANEGARVSVFIQAVRVDEAATRNPLIRAWLAGVGPQRFSELPAQPRTPATVRSFDENRRPLHDYEKRNGYQPDFLSVEIPPPSIDRAVGKWGGSAYNSDTGEVRVSLLQLLYLDVPRAAFALCRSREHRRSKPQHKRSR